MGVQGGTLDALHACLQSVVLWVCGMHARGRRQSAARCDAAQQGRAAAAGSATVERQRAVDIAIFVISKQQRRPAWPCLRDELQDGAPQHVGLGKALQAGQGRIYVIPQLICSKVFTNRQHVGLGKARWVGQGPGSRGAGCISVVGGAAGGQAPVGARVRGAALRSKTWDAVQSAGTPGRAARSAAAPAAPASTTMAPSSRGGAAQRAGQAGGVQHQGGAPTWMRCTTVALSGRRGPSWKALDSQGWRSASLALGRLVWSCGTGSSQAARGRVRRGVRSHLESTTESAKGWSAQQTSRADLPAVRRRHSRGLPREPLEPGRQPKRLQGRAQGRVRPGIPPCPAER